MSHERQAIRDALVTQLTGHTSAGSKVFRTRVGPVRDEEIPCVCVFVDGETIDEEFIGSSPRVLQRTVTVAVEGWVRVAPGSDLDAAMDTMALDIETAIDADPYLGGAAFYSYLNGTDFAAKMDGKHPVGVVHLSYAVTYRTQQRKAPPPDALKVLDARTSIGGEADPVEDRVTFP